MKVNDVTQEFSNLTVACNFESMATQFNLRLNTLAGLGDLLYSVLYSPIEGFFLGSFDDSVQNIMWNSVYNIYQGFYQRQSMTCVEAGFQFGVIF